MRIIPIFCLFATIPVCGLAQLVRVANTTLALPPEPPAEATGYTTENAFGSLAFSLPIAIRNVPGQSSHLFVVQRNSGIERVNLAQNTRSTFLDLAAHLNTTGNPQRRLAITSENGILSLAFHPDYNQNGFFYVFYSTNITNVSNTGAQLYQRVSRFQANGTPGAYDQAATANPASEVPLISQRDQAGNHNGGDMHFGSDGYLYISTGDEGGGNDEWNNARFIDKDFFSAVLRIDVDILPGSLPPNPHVNQPSGAHIASAVHAGTYAIPADNPFIGATTHHGLAIDTAKLRTEIWACGFRNPWRMSFDDPTGRLFVADVGQGTREEVDLVTAGKDYGWSYREGNLAFNSGPGGSTPPAGFNPTAPIHDYARSLGYSITGGVVSRGARLGELAGSYVFADYGSGRVWSLSESGGVWTSQQLFQDAGNNIVAFGTDPRNGDILYCMIGSGVIKRIVRASGGGTPLPALLSQTGAFSNLANLTPHAGIVAYQVNLPFWSDHAEKRRWFSIPDVVPKMQWAKDANWQFPAGQVWIKHFDIETELGNPASKRRLETRFLVKNPAGAYGVTYRWRADQTDADLVASSGLDELLPSSQTWRFPSRSECMTCHTTAAGFALSFNTRQLNRDQDYSGSSQNQLGALAQAGYFSNALTAVTSLPRMVAAGDDTQSLEIRARSYLAVNCAPCHQPGGGGGNTWDLRAHVTTEDTGVVGGVLNNPNGDAANRFFAPGDTAHSMAVTRMQGGGGLSRMPPIGNRVTDTVGVDLLTDWINMELPAWRSFAGWQTENFGSSEDPEAAPDYDWDGDGRSNRMEYLVRSDPKSPDGESLIRIQPSGGETFEIHVPEVFNRSVLIETSTGLSEWQPWDAPGNTPDFPAAGGGVKIIEGSHDDMSRFFRANFASP
jgi:uncharacterized repeat protein (TIGR03806 family)